MSPNRIVFKSDPAVGRDFHRKPTRRTGAQKRKERGSRAARTASGRWVRGRRGGLAGYQR